MRISRLIALCCLAAGCRAAGSATPPPAPAVDSIVLERGPCFGTCPSYRLSLARTGAVRFQSRNPGDTTRVETGAVTPAAFQSLGEEAERIGFDRYPASLEGTDSCRQMATDLPSATVSLFRRGREKRVVDYHGCFPGIPELRGFEAHIDSVAGSSRWVRPASRR